MRNKSKDKSEDSCLRSEMSTRTVVLLMGKLVAGMRRKAVTFSDLEAKGKQRYLCSFSAFPQMCLGCQMPFSCSPPSC